ncbi:hypothetical protein ABTY00_38125 [Streptomyces microflavus]|uniref:NucA/NucB deoxyribonuclease domain-containing protein n=1 Tax=Streptomyces microflavus TaxID=1919 RepID=UPI003324F5F1
MLYTLKDGNGSPIGTGTLNVSTGAVLSASATKWKERIAVTMTGATGAVTTLSVKFRTSCSAGCKTPKYAPWVGKTGELVLGKLANGDVEYEANPAPGSSVDVTTSYTMYVTSPGATATDPNASWSNPRNVRCDDAVRDTASTTTPSPGCVVPHVMPVINMSDQPNTSGPGAAAAAYLWAQNNLANGWGSSKPLTRAKSGIADRTARTCGTFQERTDIVATDSCDQFPFASTHEGGADGALCAEIIPSYRGGWHIHELQGGAGKSCVRAHVPLADKQSAESQLTAGYAEHRILEAEQFKVEISGSAAEPQAACLQNRPTDSLPMHGGWYRNTTDPVAHINKTTSPLGPAGTRATTAQTCVGTGSGEGTPAQSMDITGWLDAGIFSATHSTGAGLARCHLIPNAVGGKGKANDGGYDNLVPCWQSGMNTGTPSMRTYESMLQNSVRDAKDGGILGPNDAIFYQVAPDYLDATSTIPQGVTMTARVERADGSSQQLFPDIYIPNTKGSTGLLNLGN